MNDFVPDDRAERRPRFWPIVGIALIAFVVGLALMAYAVRNPPRWFDRGSTAAPAQATLQPTSAPAPVVPAQASDTATLASRETALAAQLASLEARAATVQSDAAVAGGQAGRAEAILVVFAARRALDRGVALGYLEEQLRRRFGTAAPREVATVIQAARQPVTLEDLRQSLDDNATDLLARSGSGWFGGLGTELSNLIVLHKEGAPSPLPRDRLSRARRMIETGQVEGALAEVSRLPGSPQATQWIAAARRYVEARRALDAIEGVAIVGQVAPTAAAPVTAQPVAPTL